jgi:hypothetical protein
VGVRRGTVLGGAASGARTGVAAEMDGPPEPFSRG